MKKILFMVFGLIHIIYGIYWAVSSLMFHEAKWVQSLILDSQIPSFVAHIGWLPLFLGGLLLFHRER